ncbi:MAG TPA: hypothetical protein VIT68_04870 [Candidatus Gracilibacteria bacterium]
MSDQIWMEDQIAIFISQEGEILVVGENPWFEDLVVGNAGSLFKLPQLHQWEDLEVGNQYQWNGLTVLKLDPNLGLVDVGGTRSLILLEALEDWEDVLSRSVDLNADFWMLWNNQALENLPSPTKSIFVLNKNIRKPKVLERAQTEKIPLVQAKEAGEIFLEKGTEWEIKTRNGHKK